MAARMTAKCQACRGDEFPERRSGAGKRIKFFGTDAWPSLNGWDSGVSHALMSCWNSVVARAAPTPTDESGLGDSLRTLLRGDGFETRRPHD